MRPILQILRLSRHTNRPGNEVLEYALIAGVIVVAAIAVIASIGSHVQEKKAANAPTTQVVPR